MAIEEFCRSCPKVELHAHLHGSARMSTVAAMLEERAAAAGPHGGGGDREELEQRAAQLHGLIRTIESSPASSSGGGLSLEDCFTVFHCIHDAVKWRRDVERLTREVLEDFEADRTVYLELRTTPRRLEDANRREYVETVLETIQAFTAREDTRMTVRLILSVDRTGTIDDAAETLRLAQDSDVVGLDFSGNPTRGRPFSAFTHVFEAARRAGLRTTVHVAEVFAPEETDDVIAFAPDRVGHACVLSEGNLIRLHESAIPIEICPTSNVLTLKLEELSGHPTLPLWISKMPHPFSISTDDAGVFTTTPSRELARFGMALDRSYDDIAAVIIGSLRQAFIEDTALRESLVSSLQEEMQALLLEFKSKGERTGPPPLHPARTPVPGH